MEFLKNLWGGIKGKISKLFFGTDLKKLEETQKNLKKKIDFFKKQNLVLKDKVNFQKEVIKNLEKKIKELESTNKEIIIKLYADITGNKKGSVTSFEFTLSGICNKKYSDKEILKHYESEYNFMSLFEKMTRYGLQSISKVNFNSHIAGIQTKKNQDFRTDYLRVELSVKTPNTAIFSNVGKFGRIDNKFKD